MEFIDHTMKPMNVERSAACPHRPVCRVSLRPESLKVDMTILRSWSSLLGGQELRYTQSWLIWAAGRDQIWLQDLMAIVSKVGGSVGLCRGAIEEPSPITRGLS